MQWTPFLSLLFTLSWALIGIFRYYAISKGMIDVPNDRSSHTAPTPRGGGFVFSVLWLVMAGVLYFFGIIRNISPWLFLPASLVAVLGFCEDYYKLSSGLRFMAQCLLALMLLLILGEGGYLVQPFLKLPLPLCFIAMGFAIVWMINLFNFMDGADGFAGMQSAFIFGVGGLILFKCHGYELGTLAWGMVALLAGFLTWNWPTARIFMGDCGSYFLGLLVVTFALYSHLEYKIPLTVWLILTAVFWFDATLTLVRRIIAGDSWREPHKLHAYQRLIQSGWRHQTLLFALVALNLVLSALAYRVFLDPRLSVFALCATCALLFVLYILVEIVRPMYRTWYTDGAKTL